MKENRPANVLELLLECLVEPSVEDWIGECRGHPDEVAERETDSTDLFILE